MAIVLDVSRHAPVASDDGILLQDGKFCIFDKIDENVMWIEATEEVVTLFELKAVTSTNSQMTQDSSASRVSDAAISAAGSDDATEFPGVAVNWKGRDDAVRQLIHLWHKHETLFKSTSIKNDAVWVKVAAQLQTANPLWNYTWQQCKDKIKYVRKEYMKAKDWSRQSGNSPKTCPFYEEMDEALGDKPCVEPVALASSTIKRPATKGSASDDGCESDGSEESNSENKSKNLKRKRQEFKKKLSPGLKFSDVMLKREKKQEKGALKEGYRLIKI
ncbi:Zinc finger and SCAN domain-containing protein 29 [Frankliniella fusca]|uniref:Zinc finger and SCAN domain-containing protein 29 n=1 Tax=Frankliniella fusca TaxID=407009 RepID=A0AAE1HGU3_9NEOP|nr:Zinc finger and SCAN domain-containing protein 29 [Frankliniella fusca]